MSTKPPPVPARAKDLRPAADLPSYELDASDRKPPGKRAQTVNTGIARDRHSRPGIDRDAGSGWVRAAFLVFLLVGVSIAAYVWKGR